MNLRYEITPQIKDYDSIGESFRPYLMRFDNANKNFGAISTNNMGFRNSIDKNGDLIDHEEAFIDRANPFSIMLGSSAVFGVGSTSDGTTMPSVMNKLRSETWLNFGGRAYNSTQELLLMSLHLRAKPKHIIIFSGVNNLTLSYLSEKTSSLYNSFFGESAFRASINSPALGRVGIRKSILHFFDEVLCKIRPDKKVSSIRTKKNVEDDYENIIKCFERDLFCAKAIADGHGSLLTYVVQPLATWIDKKLSEEERRLFEFLDSLSADWKVLSEHLGSWKKRYFDDLEKICLKLSVPFINLNIVDFESSDWLFVDRVHLTDSGYALAANLINQNIEP
jgi:hypothetical protein